MLHQTNHALPLSAVDKLSSCHASKRDENVQSIYHEYSEASSTIQWRKNNELIMNLLRDESIAQLRVIMPNGPDIECATYGKVQPPYVVDGRFPDFPFFRHVVKGLNPQPWPEVSHRDQTRQASSEIQTNVDKSTTNILGF